MVKLTSVKHCQLKDVSTQDLNDGGMNTLEDVIRDSGRIYDGMNEESLVTVFRWKLI